jgi:hypothetical protein
MFINQCQGGRHSCAIDQVKRTQAEAQANAASGKGIKNSLHLDGLAVDILIYKDGVYLTNTDDYQFAGHYWKVLDNDNAWGGDLSKPDGNHFSHAYG